MASTDLVRRKVAWVHATLPGVTISDQRNADNAAEFDKWPSNYPVTAPVSHDTMLMEVGFQRISEWTDLGSYLRCLVI